MYIIYLFRLEFLRGLGNLVDCKVGRSIYKVWKVRIFECCWIVGISDF